MENIHSVTQNNRDRHNDTVVPGEDVSSTVMLFPSDYANFTETKMMKETNNMNMALNPTQIKTPQPPTKTPSNNSMVVPPTA